MKFKCEYCDEEFDNGKVKANHIRWKHKKINNGFSENGLKNIKEGNKRKKLKRKIETVKCSVCDKEFEVEYKIGKKKEKYFCSRSCANKRKHSKETKAKISKALKIEREPIFCQDCGVKISYRSTTGYCKKCQYKHRYDHLDKNKVHYYRQQCQFNFNLADYPDEFDFSLVEEYGWYKASNRGNNLGGVSRDHMVSISYGFDNNIDPEIIGHPANCQLLIHNENASKGNKSSIELKDLLERIEKWNNKYRY